MNKNILLPVWLSLAAIPWTGVALGSVTVTLQPSVSTASVGTPITWTAKATDTSNSSASFTYQFSVGTSSSNLQVRRDFSGVATFPWTPTDEDGTYVIGVVAKERTGNGSASKEESFHATSRVTGNSPVISSTGHPLVALYSGPPCPAGSTTYVRFRRTAGSWWYNTPTKSCNGSTSMNFYIAGMRASTEYTIEGHVVTNGSDKPYADLTYTTGSVPSSVKIEPYSVAKAAPGTPYPVVLTAPATASTSVPFATDSLGNLIWYLPQYQSGGVYMTRPVPGGTFLGVFNDSSGIFNNGRLLREYDVAGNFIRETNVGIVSAQLTALGTDPITSFHHEAFRFANGDTGLLGSIEKVADQGSGPVDVLGDMVIVLDSNLQVKFFWDEFDHLDIKRPAILGETCKENQGGCPHIYNPSYSVANDWTHSNSLEPTPDGNLILSIRHQDWVIKIEYNSSNPKSNGPSLWTLGKDGDFTVNSSDSYPWFSHQHDVNFSPNTLYCSSATEGHCLTDFDNGNTRISENGGAGDSRGQSWSLDEVKKVATPVLNLDLGAFSLATGSSRLLSTGDYHFYLGFIQSTNSKTVEYKPTGVTSGTLQFEEDIPQNIGYRSFRMVTLYNQD